MLTYGSLKTLIQDTAENDDTNFIATIPTFVSIVERRLTKDIDTFGMVQFTSATFTPGNPFIVKPTTLQAQKALVIRSDTGRRTNLILKTNEYLNEYWPERTSVGTPKMYANFGADQWIFAPAPVSAIGLEIEMVAQPTALTDLHPTNWFTQFAAEALFYGAMAEATRYMKNYDAANVWEGSYTTQVAMLRNEARRQRRDDQQVPASPQGGENNLDPNGL